MPRHFDFFAAIFVSDTLRGGDNAGDKWETTGTMVKRIKTIAEHDNILGQQEDTKGVKKINTGTKHKYNRDETRTGQGH